MTRNEAISWCQSKLGQAMDFDKAYGAQCVDFFNFYYQYIVGANPYSHGYGVPGAKDLWNVPNSRFNFIVNNPNDFNQLPKPGDIVIYNGNMPGSGGYGHVAVVGEAKNVYYEQNYGGMYVKKNTRQFNGYEIGWLELKAFNEVIGDEAQMIKNPEFIKNMYRWVGGREPTATEVAIHSTGTPESLLNGFIAGNDLEVQRLRVALEATRQQVIDTQTALANEQAKPPKEVIKEVEKIVEKVVEVEKPVYIQADEKVVVENWLQKLWLRLFNK
jgi:hypothetical protein